MPNPFRSLIRMSAFWGKEIFEILRQPRMIFVLVLGPFLILLIFGIGYQNKPPTFRTLFVAPRDSQIYQHIQEYVKDLGPQMIFAGVTDDEAQAMDRLRRDEVDLVAVAPKDAEQKLQQNQQAVFTVYDNQIDPLQANWTKYYSYVYVSEVNRRIVAQAIDRAKGDASKVKGDLQQAHNNARALQDALQKGDQATADQKQKALSSDLDVIALAMGAGFGVLGGAQEAVGTGSSGGGRSSLMGALNDIHQNAGALNSSGSGNNPSKLEQVNKIDRDLTTLESQLDTYQKIDSNILVSPFWNEVKGIVPVNISATDFYAPAVLALLLQHLAVTLAALSIVRERTAGTMELFRVSPIGAVEALLGKYVSYIVFGAFIAAILTALLVFVLHVPMLGNWGNLALVMAGILFASLSIGFVISLVSHTDSQAVQLTMLVLLASVFFSGFIMDLNSLIPTVRTLSGLVPTTYGIVLLRDIMLRGTTPSTLLVGLLFGLGIVFYLIAWIMTHRLISRPRA